MTRVLPRTGRWEMEQKEYDRIRERNKMLCRGLLKRGPCQVNEIRNYFLYKGIEKVLDWGQGLGDFRKHLLEERGRSLDSRRGMNQSTEVEIHLKHISRNVNNAGDKHR